MSRYNQYNSYYDPVGSQSNQPSGYTYQTSSSRSSYPSAVTPSTYGSNYQSYGNNSYGNRQYGTGTGQQPSSSASHAAEALNSLSGQNSGQTSSTNRTDSSNQYSNSNWFAPGTDSNVYTGSNLALPNRSQANNSPIYSPAQTQSSSAFDRISAPEQTQSSSTTFGAGQGYPNAPSSVSANSRYQSAYSQPQSQHQRYNSPLNAVQAQQHGHSKQASRGSTHLPSPQMAQAARSSQQNRQQSSSVEPSPTTVDPSQVYDNRAELQRKAQIGAERRRKYEAEQAKKAEEQRMAAEKHKEEEEKQKAEEAAAAAKKKTDQDRKNEQRRKTSEEKQQSKSAATALQRMASGTADSSAPPANDEEAEMRAMFKKMREFNAKNPAMLAKLWDEERKSHEAGKSSLAATARAPASASPTTTSSATGKMAQKQTTVQKPPQTTAQPKALNATSPSMQKATQPATGPQTQPPAGQANTSLWPPHKKGTLAEATAKWLMSLPQNAGKTVSREAVLNILNGNPSYVQLCESLEAFGVKFERSALARELLRAVPDGLKAQPATPGSPSSSPVNGASPQPNGVSAGLPDMSMKGQSKKNQTGQGPGSSSAAAASTVSYEAPLSLSDAAREVNSMDHSGYQSMYGSPQQAQQSPYFTQPQALPNGSRGPSQSQPPEVKQEDAKVQEAPRPPADKEEAARKRTFGDLVDLTADDSDDEGPPPKRLMQPPPAPVNGTNTLQRPVPFKQFMFNPNQTPSVTGQGMAFPPPAPSAQMTLPSQARGQQPPNGVPQSVQQLAVQLPNKQRGPTAEQLQQARMKGRMLVEPIMRDRVARKSNYDSRTIARDVLLATGRHPDMRGLNAHLVNMQKLLAQHGGEGEGGGNRADLSTIRWDIIDPEPAKDAKKESSEGVTASVERPTPRTAATTQSAVNYDAPNLEPKPKKKRGRPPRYSLPDPATAGVAPLTNRLGASTSTPRPNFETATSRPATPSSAPASATTHTNMPSGTPAVGYASFQQLTAEGKKKKGRPFGWRKDIHSREAQGLPKAQAPAPKGLPGRPKLSTPSKQEPIQPHYQVYKCGWAGCGSELHNLDTLKKHLVKVHGQKGEREEGGEYACLWEGCKGDDYGRLARFSNIEGWVSHVDAEHLRPVAWKLGDGPRAGAAVGE